MQSPIDCESQITYSYPGRIASTQSAFGKIKLLKWLEAYALSPDVDHVCACKCCPMRC